MFADTLPWEAKQPAAPLKHESDPALGLKDESDRLVAQVVSSMATEGGTGASTGSMEGYRDDINVKQEDKALQKALEESFAEVKGGTSAPAAAAACNTAGQGGLE